MSNTICYECSIKLSITQQSIGVCKCKHVFCKKHKVNHICSFDYHKYHKQILCESNPHIKYTKVEQI